MTLRAGIEAAHARIAPHIRETPILRLEEGALGLDIPVWLKLEHLQITGSFKVRGAFENLLTRGPDEAGVVAFSGGNHGAAVAYAATKLGVKSTIFVPKHIAKPVKNARMRGFGAEVIEADGSVAEVLDQYIQFAEDTGALAVHPYDTHGTLAGQGTVAREAERQIDGLDTLIVSVGGGGLIGGIAGWCERRIKVVSAETEGTATLARTMKEGPGVEIRPTGVAASSLGGPNIGALPYEVLKENLADSVVVSDADVYEAQRRLWEAARVIGEPGAAVAVAALTSGAYRPEPGERVGVIFCGGNEEPDWFLKDGA